MKHNTVTPPTDNYKYKSKVTVKKIELYDGRLEDSNFS